MGTCSESSSTSKASAASPCCSGSPCTAAQSDPFAWFSNMIGNCLEYAKAEQDAGRPLVGILCEFTPRELIMAAGAIPVCLCAGSAETIPAAEEHLPANLCPLIKSTYGYHVLGTNPFLEMAALVVAETTCDGKKKMYELMAERRPMYVLELPQKPDDPDAFDHWVREVRKLKHALEQLFDVEITDDKLREAIGVMNRERALRRALAECMKGAPPPITGRRLIDLKSSISGISVDLAQYEAALEMLNTQGGDPALAGRVRVLMTGVPIVHGAERVLEIVEDSGGVVVCMENCSGLKPIVDDVVADAPDPIQAIAEKYFHLPCSIMTRNSARMDLLRELAAGYRVDCVVELVWRACITYDVESRHVRRLVEEELRLPYLQIEADYSLSDSARIQVRVEALFETVRNAQRTQTA